MSDSIEQLGSDIEEYCDSVEEVNAIAAFCERQAAITLAECESNEKQAFREKDEADAALAECAIKLHNCEKELDKRCSTCKWHPSYYCELTTWATRENDLCCCPPRFGKWEQLDWETVRKNREFDERQSKGEQ